MFDFNWSEIALIGVVALVLIGPKDMPVAIRGITALVRKMRRMAGEFQHHVDDMMRDADLAEVKSTIDEVRGLNLKNVVRRTIDPDGSVGRAFADPFQAHPVPPVMTKLDQRIDAPVPTPADAPATIQPDPPAGAAPAFIPPAFIPPGAAPPRQDH